MQAWKTLPTRDRSEPPWSPGPTYLSAFIRLGYLPGPADISVFAASCLTSLENSQIPQDRVAIVQSSEEHFLEEAWGLLGQDLPSHPVPSGPVPSHPVVPSWLRKARAHSLPHTARASRPWVPWDIGWDMCEHIPTCSPTHREPSLARGVSP